MKTRTVECDLVELENKLIVFMSDDMDHTTLRQVDKLLKQRGSKHLCLIAISNNDSIESLNIEDAKRILNHIIEQEEEKNELSTDDH